jgi:hypothetical protein
MFTPLPLGPRGNNRHWVSPSAGLQALEKVQVLGISLSRDRSIVPSKLSFSVFEERLSRKSYNVEDFPFAFHIPVQQPLKPLWSPLLLCDHEPSQASTFLCFMSLLMSLLPTSEEFVSEFPSPRENY